MKRTVIYELGLPIKVESIDGKVRFSNGMCITDYHSQDWCENVYADWSSLEDTGFLGSVHHEVIIENVEGVGFRINGFTVHCYDEQNGYYSNQLELNIKGGLIKTIDITECSEYRYW